MAVGKLLAVTQKWAGGPSRTKPWNCRTWGGHFPYLLLLLQHTPHPGAAYCRPEMGVSDHIFMQLDAGLAS